MKPRKGGRSPYSNTSVSGYWSNFFQACSSVPKCCSARTVAKIIFEAYEASYWSLKG